MSVLTLTRNLWYMWSKYGSGRQRGQRTDKGKPFEANWLRIWLKPDVGPIRNIRGVKLGVEQIYQIFLLSGQRRLNCTHLQTFWTVKLKLIYSGVKYRKVQSYLKRNFYCERGGDSCLSPHQPKLAWPKSLPVPESKGRLETDYNLPPNPPSQGISRTQCPAWLSVVFVFHQLNFCYCLCTEDESW